jgi:RNA polymerase sigma-70 factor (ECF subfamily)
LLYNAHIKKQALTFCRQRDIAEEIADSTLTYLFLSEHNRPRRIASYQGLSSLSSWLSVVIHNRAITEQCSIKNNFDRIEEASLVESLCSTDSLETAIRCSRYKHIVLDSLGNACRTLSDYERWFLTLRYEEGLKVKQIAELAKLTSPTVTYHIQRAQEKLRKAIRYVLITEYGLNEMAIRECIEEVLENPIYSLLNVITDVSHNREQDSPGGLSVGLKD